MLIACVYEICICIFICGNKSKWTGKNSFKNGSSTSELLVFSWKNRQQPQALLFFLARFNKNLYDSLLLRIVLLESLLHFSKTTKRM